MNATHKVNRIITLADEAAASDSPKAAGARLCAKEAREYLAKGRLSAAAYRAATGVEMARGWRHPDAREAYRLYEQVAP